MTGNKHPAPLQSWQDGERGQPPPGQAQIPSPSTIPIKSQHKGMTPLSFPLCEQPSQPSSPTPELLSADPHNPAVPKQLITPIKGTEGLPKKPCPPDQLNGWMRMFTQRGGNVHVRSAPLCPDKHTRRSCVFVWLWYGWQWGFTGHGRPPQADCTSSPHLHTGFASSP